MKLILNTLFGRWGMADNPIESVLMDWEGYYNLRNTNKINHTWVINESSSDNNLIVEYNKTPDIDLIDNDDLFYKLMEKVDQTPTKHISSVGIAAATTAYARMDMYENTTLPGVVYTDTDSIFIDGDAPTDIIGDHLGGLKLESIVRNGLFVKPKIYTYECKNSDGMWVNKYKFKGINNDLVRNNSNCYIELYKGNNVTFDVNRFKKYRGCGVYDVYMTMSINPPDNSKRVMVFDNDGKWVDTEPLIFIDTSDGGTIITVNEWYKLLGDDIYTHNICRKPDIQSPHDNVTTPLIIYENGTVPVIDEQSPEDRRDILRRQHANIIRRKINKLNKQLNALKNEWKKRKKTQKWRRCTRVFSKKGKKKGDEK